MPVINAMTLCIVQNALQSTTSKPEESRRKERSFSLLDGKHAALYRQLMYTICKRNGLFKMTYRSRADFVPRLRASQELSTTI